MIHHIKSLLKSRKTAPTTPFFNFFFFRWKTHKWRRCQLIPWSVRQDSPGAQETCGPGMQVRGEESHTHTHTHTHRLLNGSQTVFKWQKKAPNREIVSLSVVEAVMRGIYQIQVFISNRFLFLMLFLNIFPLIIHTVPAASPWLTSEIHPTV